MNRAQVARLRRLRRLPGMAAACLALLGLSGVASAKPRKPSVCVDYQLAESKAGHVIAVCYDGSSPKVFEAWTIVKLTTDGNVTASYLVGL